MKMKKILFHINSLGKGGAERVVSVLAEYFAHDGYEVVLTTQWKAQEEYELDPTVRRISVGLNADEEKRSRISKIFLRIRKYRKIIERENPDIVISFCAKANFRSAYALTFLPTPLLVSVRNDPHIDYAPYVIATKYMEKKAAGCVFQTEQAREFFNRNFQNKSRIIWNPLSEKFTNVENKEIAIQDRESVIVNIGRITTQKNQLLLVKAFEQVSKKYPQYQLHLYGEDSGDGSKEKIDEYIKNNCLQDKVIFKGVTNQVKEVLNHAYMFVLSSNYEGMPNALIEAMVTGIPVISTDCPCGGPSMVIRDGESGLLVPVGDQETLQEAMERILSNSEFAAQISSNEMKIIHNVDPDCVYRQWKEYVDQIIEHR